MLAALTIGLLAPFSLASANGESQPISIYAIQGITPPVAGATPVQAITPNDQYTGVVVWSNIEGPLIGNFETLTSYVAEILITPKPGYTLDGLDENFFTVAGASSVNNNPGSGEVTAIFNPIVGDAADYLDATFGTNGSFNIKDIFGAAPLNDSNTAVGPIKIDRIAVDSKDRIVVLASFYDANNQLTLVPDAERDAVGTGFQNSMNIAGQQGNVLESSAAVDALDYVSTVADVDFTDWYLPSLDELYELYNSTVGVTLMDVNYWSSTQADASNARYKSFLNGSESASTKSSEFAVRPIRSGTLVGPTVGNTGPGGGKIFYVANTPFYCGSTLSETCNYLEVAPGDWYGGMEDPSISWSTDFSLDNHILFRLEDDGSYDTNFGVGGPSLRKVEGDTPKPYVLVTTTGSCYSFSERVDLEIDSQDKILVLLSGIGVDSQCGGIYHNFVARYNSDGVIDLDFADKGVIGSLEPQQFSIYDYPGALFTDFIVDAVGQIVIAGFPIDNPSELIIYRFESSGVEDPDFCADYLSLSNPEDCDEGTAYVPIAQLNFSETSVDSQDLQSPDLRSLQIIADGAGGYVIAYTDPSYDVFPGIFSQLIRLQENGQVDPTLGSPIEGDFIFGDYLILPDFFVTDLALDGSTGFILSGTFLSGPELINIYGAMVRIKWDGSFDTEFFGPSNPDLSYLSPLISNQCFNTALLGNDIARQSSIGIIKGNFCAYGQAEGSSVKAFSPQGSFRGELLIEQPTDESESIVNQLKGTSNGKILTLSGTRPTMGALGFLVSVGFAGSESNWTEATITRYQLPESLIAPPGEPLGITGPEQVVGTVGRPINPVSFTVTGGTGTETITVTSGYALPAGLSLSSAGLISGTPLAAGTTTTSFTVTDSSNETLTASIEFVFTLTAQALTITGPSRITGTVGTAITPVNLILGGGTGPETATVTAGFALPAGLTLSTAGRISGTPTAAGTTTTSFTVTDSLNETATATVEFVISLVAPPAPVVYVAPTPVPYLKTLTTPKLNLKDGKLLCTPGTYNAGYTLDGVIQGSTTTLFTPSSFTYNLLINGITQTSLAVTSSSTSHSWTMPASTSGALITCSVTVTANGLTNTDKSGDNTSGASSALTTQTAAIATANATYSTALSANTKAYQKALVDNRTQWRSTTEKIRTDYYAERNRINSLPSTKATRALSSAALKAYTAALKKSAADYKASGPAALAAKDVADKAALDAKTTALAKANAAYGTAIESIGYGVLIP